MSAGSAVFVIGPAGTGKSTFCNALMKHCGDVGRSVHLVNLDPAAENFEYEPSKDIRDLISVEDAMEESHLGPNGGLIFCLEHLVDNIDWLEEDLGGYDDDFLIIDCPGQIELYAHYSIMSKVVQAFARLDYRICAVYLMESQFLQDTAKFFAGVLNATAAMLQLGIPHINAISKMDLLQRFAQDEVAPEDAPDDNEEADIADELHDLYRYFHPDPSILAESFPTASKPKFFELNRAIVQMLDEFNMVNFIPINIRKEQSLANILSHIDNAIQYGEQLEPKEPKDMDPDGSVDSLEQDLPRMDLHSMD